MMQCHFHQSTLALCSLQQSHEMIGLRGVGMMQLKISRMEQFLPSFPVSEQSRVKQKYTTTVSNDKSVDYSHLNT